MFKPGDKVRTIDGEEGIIVRVDRVNKGSYASVTHDFDILITTDTYASTFHANLWYNENQLELIK